MKPSWVNELVSRVNLAITESVYNLDILFQPPMEIKMYTLKHKKLSLWCSVAAAELRMWIMRQVLIPTFTMAKFELNKNLKQAPSELFSHHVLTLEEQTAK